MPSELVYLICNVCGKPTPSGIAADPETLANTSNTFRDNVTECSICGNPILWSKAELWPESVVKEHFRPK